MWAWCLFSFGISSKNFWDPFFSLFRGQKKLKKFWKHYRVYLKFSDTWNVLFVVNCFISIFFWGNTQWKKVSSQHSLKNLMKLSKHGISYSLKCDPRSISKITFYANLRVRPIDTELWYFFQKFFIQVSNTLVWMRSVWWLCWTVFFRFCEFFEQI